MTIVRIPDENRVKRIRRFETLVPDISIDYKRWVPVAKVSSETYAVHVLDAYQKQINEVKTALDT